MKLLFKLMLIAIVTQLFSCVIVINHPKENNRIKDSTIVFRKEAFPIRDFYRDAQRRRELKRYGRKDN